MKWIFLVLFAVLFLATCTEIEPTTTSYTSSTIDSILNWVDTAEKDTNLEIGIRKELLDRAYFANQRLVDDTHKLKNLSKISLAYLALSDTLRFRLTNWELMALAKSNNDPVVQGEAHWDLAAHMKRVRPDSAYYHSREAYHLFKKAHLDSTNIDYPGRVLYLMSRIRESCKDYVGAESDIIKAIAHFEETKNAKNLYRAYNQLGIIQNGLKKFEKALEYYSKAKTYIPLTDTNDQYVFAVQNANNIANTYLRKGEFKTAFTLFDELEKDQNLLRKKPLLYAKVLSSKGYSGLESNMITQKQSLGLLAHSNSILDSLGNQYNKARNYEYLAYIFLSKKDTTNALNSGLCAMRLARATSNNERLLSGFRLMTTIDAKKAGFYAKQYFVLSEKLQQEERILLDKFARIRMETDKIIEENASLAKQKELYSNITLILLTLGTGVFIIIMQHVNNQRLKFKQKQQEANQEIYNIMLDYQGRLEEGKKTEQKRVSQELHDGVLGDMLGIRLILSSLNERNDASAIEQRAQLIKKIQEVEEEIRNISHELSASAYKKVNNFILSIRELINTVSESTKIQVSFTYSEEFHWDTLIGEIKINSYRMIQECLQNGIKHARCKQILVDLRGTPKSISILIEDDGTGFDVNKVKKGIGLKNIISRAEDMKGTLNIESVLGKGTNINIVIPTKFIYINHPKTRDSKETETVIEV